jgi:hypothetical protein
MLKVNAFQAEQADALGTAERSMIERRQRLLGPAYQLFYDHPLHLVRGLAPGCTTAKGLPTWTCTTMWRRSATAIRAWSKP